MSFSSSLKAFYFKLTLPLKASFVRLFDFLLALRYWRYPKFWTSYLYLTFLSWKNNPYRVSQQFHKEKKKNIHQFGTTPLFTLDRLASEVGILSDDRVLELGSGTGHTLLWLSQVIGCHCIGVEWVPQFVEKLNRVIEKRGLQKIKVLEEDYLKTDLSKASVIYLYGTCMEEEEITQFCSRLNTLRFGCKVITVSFSLNEYCPEIEVEKTFPLYFPWGKAEGYLHVF